MSMAVIVLFMHFSVLLKWCVFCVWSLFCGVVRSVLSSFIIIFLRKRELIALLHLVLSVV